MRIKAFSHFVKESELKDFTLKNSMVVIDAQNFFYDTYKKSSLPYAFGCESDLYAAYIREYLSIFQKANIRCYFIFKGGHKDIEKRLKIQKCVGRNFEVGRFQNDIVQPIFAKSVCLEILEELGFEYVISEYESKRDCIALAQKLNCPIMANDIEYCFSGVCYIPTTTLHYNKQDNSLFCQYFLLKNFLKKYGLTKENLSLFILLTDESILPGDTFQNLFKYLKISLQAYQRNITLLQWLSSATGNRNRIVCYLSKEKPRNVKATFLKAENNVLRMIGNIEPGSVAIQCLLEGMLVRRQDTLWFPKGVALKHIAIDYVNLYRHKIFLGPAAIEDNEQDDATQLSLEIIKYAFDLLTNYRNEGFTLVCEGNEQGNRLLVTEDCIEKPYYRAVQSVFENGWNGFQKRGIFEHFLNLQDVELYTLDRLPDDAKLLMLTLVYFSSRKAVDTCCEVYSILLSYVLLSVVFEKIDKNNLPKHPFTRKPIRDPFTDKQLVTQSDCEIAAAIMKTYCTTSLNDTECIFDRKMLHPLVEFQHCLQHLNYLNTLCGAPFTATKFSKTYNGTLVFKILRDMKLAGSRGELGFLEKTLISAPTVYGFLNGLIGIYEELQ